MSGLCKFLLATYTFMGYDFMGYLFVSRERTGFILCLFFILLLTQASKNALSYFCDWSRVTSDECFPSHYGSKLFKIRWISVKFLLTAAIRYNCRIEPRTNSGDVGKSKLTRIFITFGYKETSFLSFLTWTRMIQLLTSLERGTNRKLSTIL